MSASAGNALGVVSGRSLFCGCRCHGNAAALREVSRAGYKGDTMSKTSTAIEIIRPVALGLGIFGATAAIGAAQVSNPCAPAAPPAASAWNTFDPTYSTVDAWQSAWDTGAYDRNHILLGTVGKFAPSRLTITSAQGDTMTIDLKEGTVIRPTGSTPTAGQRVAVFGYWSNGTFIANRVVLRG
jgi:hypothetical protein